jgi:alkylhydroperoxidase/carboxymuconolactone decarboxylase family protein YurZ
MDEREQYRRGLSVRRAVLGAAHVGRALRGRTALTEEFQDLITRYAWGEIWTRPGLPRSTRSLITLAMLVALDRSDELRLHLQAAARGRARRSPARRRQPASRRWPRPATIRR